MSKARTIHLHKRMLMHKDRSRKEVEEIVRKQMLNVFATPKLLRVPRETLNLDGTKISAHQGRVDAMLRGQRIAPITIDMALTQKCSYACTFCYAGLQQNDQSPVPWEVYENFLDDCVEIGHAPGEGVRAISLVSDGESTENPNYLRFIKKARDNGIEVAAGTNGFKLKWDELPYLIENLTYLRFNFDAADPKAYAEIMGTSEKSYETVLDNIKECVRLKEEIGSEVTIGLQMVLLPEYADQVLPLAILGRSLGVDYTIFKHCSDDETGRLGVDYSWYTSPLAIDLLKAAEGLSTDTYSVQAKWSKMRTGRDRKYSRCYGTPLLLQMSGTGIVAPCGSFFHEKYKRYHIGDIKETRFRDIWASDEYAKVINHLKSDDFDAKTMCASLCLQDKVNEALKELIEDGKDLPPASIMHRNFI